METLFPSTEYVRELENGLSYYRYLHWINYEFLSFPWILLTIIAILVIILWIKLVARKNLIEILLFGVLIAITGVTFDEFGYEYRLWRYNYHIISQFPHILWIHLFILPIIYMLIYQYFPKWKAFLTVMIISAFMFAFIFEPILVLLNYYELLKWNYSYSVPIYILLGVVYKGLIEWLKMTQIKATK